MCVCRVYEEDNEEAIKQCQVLLEESNIDLAVRIGDIYGFLVEHFTKKEKWKAVSFSKPNHCFFNFAML